MSIVVASEDVDGVTDRISEGMGRVEVSERDGEIIDFEDEGGGGGNLRDREETETEESSSSERRNEWEGRWGGWGEISAEDILYRVKKFKTRPRILSQYCHS